MIGSIQEEEGETPQQESNLEEIHRSGVGQFLRRITRYGVQEDETPLVPKKGMSLSIATIFIVGEMAGSGVLALPKALAGTSWIGILIIIVCCINACYCGIHLGRCWLILEERWEEYRVPIRNPYPSIGEKAYGIWMKRVISFCVDVTLFGASVVYLLLCASLVGALLNTYAGLVFCSWIPILAAVLLPFTYLGTPADIWYAAVGALATTATACICIVISIAPDAKPEDHYNGFYANATFESLFLSFGTILFAFGGASTFPTFQNDMRDKKQFPKAAVFGFIGLFLIYIPVAVSGYTIFGNEVKDNILDNVTDGKLKTTVQVLLAGHFLVAFLIVFNPLAQDMEEIFKVPHSYNWKRFLLRTCIMVSILFAGLSIPHFGKILNLVGASSVTLMTFVFPPIFYMKLCDQTKPESRSRLSFSDASMAPAWPEHNISLHKRVYLYEIIGIGVLGGAISTYQAITGIADPAAFTPPCYINSAAAGS